VPRRQIEPEPPVTALARTAMAAGLKALAEADLTTALRWLDRAHRLLPTDPNAALALASACLGRDPARAEALFTGIVAKHDVQQAWVGLATARLRLSGPEAAAEPLAAALSRHALNPGAAPLADRIGLSGGFGGWCGLTWDGTLDIHPASSGDIRITLDGKPLSGRALPAGWSRKSRIDVSAGGKPLLGSPIRIDRIRRVSGCVEVCGDGIRGWAWHPGDPERPAELNLVYGPGSGRPRQTIVANDETSIVPDTGPLARARSFHVTRAALRYGFGPIHVTGPDGQDLLGSPLDPFADQALNVGAALRLAETYPARSRKHIFAATGVEGSGQTGTVLRADAAAAADPRGADGRRRAVTVVIPVHNGRHIALACIASVLASGLTDAGILVVDDGSTDSALIAALDELALRRAIKLMRHHAALGFPAAANAGMRAAPGRDVVLLNSDTLVPPGWLVRLKEAAYSSRDIGTVTPLSNDATILSYPGPAGTNPVPDQTVTNRLDRLARRANGGALVDIPVGVGFCLYLRRDCLNATGSFRADRFAQGYGEENDFCLRARALGWRNVALTGLFIGHLGGNSFGTDAVHLQMRNGKILEQLHPGQGALTDAFIAREPLADYRRRIDVLRWRAAGRHWRNSAILITHDHGGGVEARIDAAVAEHAAAGRRPIVLRPAETACGHAAVAVCHGTTKDFPNLVFALPQELPALLQLLRSARPGTIEVHHLLHHPGAIYALIARLRVPYEVHIHDYAWFCPRLSLVAASRRYCGEPDLHDCEACVVDNGHFLREAIGVGALRKRSAEFLSLADRVVVPTADAGQRMRRHFPGLSPRVVAHEEDTLIAPPAQTVAAAGGVVRICVVGAIGVHKGYDVLLACARDAARRDLGLEFVVVGHTIDDERLMATGRVFVTGRFEPDEAVSLIAAQHAALGFVASIWPETWCLSLGDIWRAGLRTVAFDIGAPAERIKQSGYGILLPLGLSPSAINNVLIASSGTTGNESVAHDQRTETTRSQRRRVTANELT
jgi:GT2 family glycosyltransferase/glycosyltransferase involved in cell wall biosynthesis